MFWVDVITKIDLTVTIGIKRRHNVRGDIIDIFTRPSTITIDNGEWTSTVEIFRIWAVFSSPGVFTSDHTVVDFTSINGTVSIFITFRNNNI